MWLWMLLWLFLRRGEATITTTTNSSDISASCTGVPYSKLNLCNVTCSTCTYSDYNYCLSCEDNFTISGTSCLLSNDTYTFIYQTHFVDLSISSAALTNWKDANLDRSLGIGDVVHLCPSASSTSSYQFEMLGLFGRLEEPALTVSFTN